MAYHIQIATLRARLYLFTVFALLVSGAPTCVSAASTASAAPGLATRARVRSTDTTILELIDEGAARSASFRALIDAIDRSHGIVYVQFGLCAFGHLKGCLLPYVGDGHGDRYLRVLVTPVHRREAHDQLIAFIGHELQHALEVIEHPEIVDLDTMQAVYRRIGMPLKDVDGFETSEARAAGDRVYKELSSNPAILAFHAKAPVVAKKQ